MRRHRHRAPTTPTLVAATVTISRCSTRGLSLDPGRRTARRTALAGHPARRRLPIRRGLVLANRLLGQSATGPRPRVHRCRTHRARRRSAVTWRWSVRVHGPVEVLVDGRPVAADTVVPVADGQTVSVGRIHRGVRAYLAVAGGLETPTVVGSRASDLLSGLGPGPLRAGDRLARGRPGPVRGTLFPPRSTPFPGTGGGITVLRALAGPHPFPEELLDRLYGTVDRIGSRSDRIGLRLEAPGTTALPATGQPSRPAWSPGPCRSRPTGPRSSSSPTTPRWADARSPPA